MALINLFIAFFVIVALAISWLVFNLVFGSDPEESEIVDEESGNFVAAKAIVAAPVVREQALVAQNEVSLGGGISTCRDAVVAAALAVTEEKGHNEFGAKEIVEYLTQKGTAYSTSTIRTHVASRCCANATSNQSAYCDFERIARGRYRLASAS